LLQIIEIIPPKEALKSVFLLIGTIFVIYWIRKKKIKSLPFLKNSHLNLMLVNDVNNNQFFRTNKNFWTQNNNLKLKDAQHSNYALFIAKNIIMF